MKTSPTVASWQYGMVGIYNAYTASIPVDNLILGGTEPGPSILENYVSYLLMMERWPTCHSGGRLERPLPSPGVCPVGPGRIWVLLRHRERAGLDYEGRGRRSQSVPSGVPPGRGYFTRRPPDNQWPPGRWCN